jgi:hypothetical protein
MEAIDDGEIERDRRWRMDRAGADPHEHRPPSDAQPDGAPDGVPEVADLRARVEVLSAEIERLCAELGAAVLDGDDDQAAALEGRLDLLGARRAGLAAELAALAAGGAAERERRRREAAERERDRRALAAARAELYDGWGALLEHRAAVAELAGELERLRAAWPIDRERLEALRRELAAGGAEIEPLVDRLEGSDDPEALRQAAARCRELARASVRASRAVPERAGPSASAAPASGASAAVGDREIGHAPPVTGADHPIPPTNPPSDAGARAAEQPSEGPLPGWLIGPTDREPPAGERGGMADAAPPPRADAAPEPAARSADGGPRLPLERATDRAASEAGGTDDGAELRLLESERARLEHWAAALDARGDPLALREEVERQLAELATRRETLEARARPRPPTARRERAGSPWLRLMGLGRDDR